MAKKRKLPKKYEEEYEQELEKISVNRLKGEKNSGPISVNRALEEEEKNSITTNKGIRTPKMEGVRDPKMEKEPIEEKDLGLAEDNFLMNRQVGYLDLMVHIDAEEKQFLGSNIRRVRDFVAIFKKGASSPENPKIDLAYNIDYNVEFKKELIAQQLLRNFHSEKTSEQRNMTKIFKEIDLWEDQDELATEFKDTLEANEDAYQDEKLIEILKDRFPNI